MVVHLKPVSTSVVFDFLEILAHIPTSFFVFGAASFSWASATIEASIRTHFAKIEEEIGSDRFRMEERKGSLTPPDLLRNRGRL